MSGYQFFGDNMDKATFAFTAATAFTPLGAAALGLDLGFRVGDYLTERDRRNDQAAAERYERERGASDRWQRAESEKRAAAYYAKTQASTEMAEIRRLFQSPELLKAEDVARNREDQFINQQIGLENLGSYRRAFEQNMIQNSRNLQLSRQNALREQTMQRLSGIKTQTEAAKADAAEKAMAAQLQREEYIKAITKQKDVMRQQSQNYEANLARSNNIIDNQQSIMEQNRMANQRALEQAAAIKASRPAQPAATAAATPRPTRTLPPPVYLPKR